MLNTYRDGRELTEHCNCFFVHACGAHIVFVVTGKSQLFSVARVHQLPQLLVGQALQETAKNAFLKCVQTPSTRNATDTKATTSSLKITPLYILHQNTYSAERLAQTAEC
jgi:hypothetical protein